MPEQEGRSRLLAQIQARQDNPMQGLKPLSTPPLTALKDTSLDPKLKEHVLLRRQDSGKSTASTSTMRSEQSFS